MGHAARRASQEAGMDGELGMKVEIARLRVEADNGRVSLQNLQRNYETLSAAYQERQSELEECARLLEEEGERADVLEERLEAAEARLREAQRPKTPAAPAPAAVDPAALAALQEQLERAQFQASVTETRAKMSHEKLQESKDHLRQARVELKAAGERLVEGDEVRGRLSTNLKKAEMRAESLAAEAGAAEARARELQAGRAAAEARATELELRERKSARMLEEAAKSYREQAHRVSELEAESKTQQAALDLASRRRQVLEDQKQAAGRRGDELAREREQRSRELEEAHAVRRDLARRAAILESDKAELRAQLSNLEARYGKVVDQSAAKDGLSSGLAEELRAVKEKLIAAERAAAEQREQSDAKVALLRKTIAKHSKETDAAREAASEMKWRHEDALSAAIRRLEAGLVRCDDLREASIEGILKSEKRLESLCVLTGQGLQLPRVDALERDVVSLLSRHDNRACALEEEAERWRSVAEARGEDATGSQKEFEKLNGQLRDAKNEAVSRLAEVQALRSDLIQLEDRRARDLEALRLEHEVQLAAQRDKIDGRLHSLQRAMDELQASSDENSKRAASLSAKEASRLQEALNCERKQQDQLRDTVGKVLDVQARMAEDVALASGHIRNLGGLTRPTSSGEPSAIQGDPADAVLKYTQQLRLQVSQLIEVSQDVASKRASSSGASVPRDPKLDEREHELQKVVSRVIYIEESLGSCYTCIACLDVFRDPVICVPCGHHFCRVCLPSPCGAGDCPECGARIDTVVVDEALESLSSKYEVKMSALKAVRNLCL